MGIKRDADLAYFGTHQNERELAQRLDEAFDITFGKDYGRLSFWLAAPKDHIAERFGLRQEVLVVYSDHYNTDARVLTAIENITRSPDFRHRLEKVLVLLVHKGQPENTAALLLEQADWVIVPIRAEELLNPQRGSLFLRSKISEHLGSSDLFGMSSPIKSDKYFFGREKLVQTLASRSIASKENTGLFGLRKTGKTSVLYAVRRSLADRRVLVEYIDCQNPGMHAARWWQALENIAFRLASTLRDDHKMQVDAKGNYTAANAGARFSSDVQAILKTGNVEQVILMLDEIEYITPYLSGALGQHWDRDFLPFWQTVRASHQENQGCLTFVVAGVNPAAVEKSHFGALPNPIFQLAVPRYLEPLPVTNADVLKNVT